MTSLWRIYCKRLEKKYYLCISKVFKTTFLHRIVRKKLIEIELKYNRTTGFLIGLVVALNLLFCALEYRSGNGGGDDSDIDLSDMAQDEELVPPQQRKDMIAVVKPGAATHAVTQRIKKVEQVPPTEVPTKLDQPDGDAADGNGVGQNSIEGDGDDQLTAQSPVATDMADNPLNFRIVEQLPEFPGGMVAFMKWITKNLRYPPEAQNQKLQGKVLVSFIIGTDGTVSEIKVVKKLHPLLDNEAVRVMKMMPRWKPGKDKGKPCLTYFCIPVNFVL